MLNSDTRAYVENLTKIGLAFILKEPLKWRNSLIVEMMSKLGALGKQDALGGHDGTTVTQSVPS